MLHGISMLKEIKDGFDHYKEAGYNIHVRERAGSTFNSFSHRCYVIEGEHKGKEVLVHHFVMEQDVDFLGKKVLLCYPDQILAVKHNQNGDTDDYDYLRNFIPTDGAIGLPMAVHNDDALHHQEVAQENWETSMIKDFNGDLIEYRKNGDYEIFYQENMFFYVKNEDIFMKDGVLQPGFKLYEDSMIIPERFIITSRSGQKIAPEESIQGEVIYEKTM